MNTENTRIERLWEAGKKIWGNAFIDKHGQEPCKLWDEKLIEFSDEHIRNVLKTIKADKTSAHHNSPPSLTDFFILCKIQQTFYGEKFVKPIVQVNDIENFKQTLIKNIMMSFTSVDAAMLLAKEKMFNFSISHDQEKHGMAMRFALRNFSHAVVKKKYNQEDFNVLIKDADKYAKNIGVKLNYSLIAEFLLENNSVTESSM